MKKFMSFTISGSGDYDDGHLKKILINGNDKVSVKFESTGKFTGRYVVLTSHTDNGKLNNVFYNVKGIASHAVLEQVIKFEKI